MERYSRPDIIINWAPEERALPSALASAIERHWNQEVVTASNAASIFNGELCRLSHWKVEGSALTLGLGITDYKELLHSNRYAQRISREFDSQYLSRALGVSAVVTSRDGYVILIERSDAVGECPGMWDVLGGHIHPEEHQVAGTPDPFLSIQHELFEEAKLRLTDLDSLICIGLIETRKTRKPELIFDVQCHLSAKRIVQLGSEENSSEIAKFISISHDSIDSFLKINQVQVSPSALGALWVHRQVVDQ